MTTMDPLSLAQTKRLAADADTIGIQAAITPTLMKSLDDKRRLAHAVLAFAQRIAGGAKAARTLAGQGA